MASQFDYPDSRFHGGSTFAGSPRLSFSLQSAYSAHAAQVKLDPSSKTQVYKDIKVGYGYEPYIAAIDS